MKLILLSGLLLSSSILANAQHGSTSAFTEKVEALPKERRALVEDTNLEFEWIQGEDSLSVNLRRFERPPPRLLQEADVPVRKVTYFHEAAAADCGCHDNRMDKIWWNEQWMSWPVDESYANNSNVEFADQLEGDLFLTVGEVDTNVDPSSTLQVVNALLKADKDFEFYPVPNAGHGIGEKKGIRRRQIQFFQSTLQLTSSKQGKP